MYSAASKEEILGAKVTVASLFFGKVFGDVGQSALTVFYYSVLEKAGFIKSPEDGFQVSQFVNTDVVKLV